MCALNNMARPFQQDDDVSSQHDHFVVACMDMNIDEKFHCPQKFSELYDSQTRFHHHSGKLLFLWIIEFEQD